MKLREIIPYILIGVLGVMFIQARCDLRDIADNAPIPYVLPDDVVMHAELKNHILELARRIDGDSSYVITEYVPTESSIKYIVRTDTLSLGRLEMAYALLNELQSQVATSTDSIRIDSLRNVIHNIERDLYIIEVEYDRSGVCLEPNIGGQLDSDIDVGISLGARMLYSGRFGGGLQGTLGFPLDSLYKSEHPVTLSAGVFGDWRIEGYENVSVKVFGERDFTRRQWAFGVGMNFYWK